MPYLYFTPESYPNKCVGVYDHATSADYCLFRCGERLPQLTKEIVIDFICTLSELSRFDSLGNTSSTLLVNPRLRALLEEYFPDGVQFFKVHQRGDRQRAIANEMDAALTALFLVFR